MDARRVPGSSSWSPCFTFWATSPVKGVGNLSLAFFTNLPNEKPPGLGNALLGSALMVSLATLAAVPLGILAALYLTEYRRSPAAPLVRFVGELLGGVPSIVLGVFAYALLVVPFGFSAWAGSFALGVMMIPVVMRASEESLKLVPMQLAERELRPGGQPLADGGVGDRAGLAAGHSHRRSARHRLDRWRRPLCCSRPITANIGPTRPTSAPRF